MTNGPNLNRRDAALFFFGALLTTPAHASNDLPKVTVYRDPTCSCCGAWAAHLAKAGFRIEQVETQTINRVKARFGVPQSLAACHTAEISGYVVEGHVPASAIQRLLAQRPDATGLATPGMPVGSPGMEVDGIALEAYDVILFGPARQSIFARFRGNIEI